MRKFTAYLAATALLASPVIAEDLAVVGSWSGLPLHKQFEAPFWSETLPTASGGSINVSLTTHNQMNLGVGDVFRLLGDGVYDVAMTVGDYAVADAPELEGLDVPLLALTADEARAMVDAARPMVSDIYRDRFNSHVLAIAPYPPQVVFCNGDVNSLADLKGLKVRASGRMTAKFLEALGAEGVNVSFAEVPGALQKGVVDCAVTGAGSGYSSGWWEVSTNLLAIPLGGWDPVVTAINLDKWNSLSTETQELIQTQVSAEFEEPAWEVAQDALVNDIACLTGNGECPSGETRNMKLVEVSEEDFNNARETLVSEVLPAWAERAGADWAKRWNTSVGQVVGVSVAAE
ncbi:MULTISPECIES: TRAP transporter substrate-binding protein [unclassified Phaeobacter]|uniref:TRAP transporter substrate-binding protein n=1 Tax=unclassified Phaeobacter TaxID=2621772 RepID=UPI003A87D07A